ncbi:MAG TPA: DUF302 domain-containing protein [Gammaproteobacteria bacterium]|nr:DUF302 domain-containing protein [Gammaproteobacteria bacterium]
MIRNILAIIGVLAIVAGGYLYTRMGPMLDLMPMMSSPEMQPMLDVVSKNPEGLKAAINNLNDGAGETATELLKKWIDAKGELATTATWAKKVQEGLSPDEVLDALSSVATEMNIKAVGDLPLSKELQARGIKSKYLRVLSYCNPETARKMVDFAAPMSAFLPCRITLVEKDDGLWLYTLNMDMMIKMGAKMSPELLKETMKVRDTLWAMLERGSTGEF